jgi:uncharacterized protein (UPF0276 family)
MGLNTSGRSSGSARQGEGGGFLFSGASVGTGMVTKPPPPSNCNAGIGLRLPHVAEIVATRPHLGFLEVHAENYMAETAALDRLLELRPDYPVSIHGVALSLGSAEELDRPHLGRFKALIERVAPVLVSEHLAWSTVGGAYLNDLLPLPYTEESLEIFCRHVGEAQETLGRRLLIENPSSYLRFRHSTIPEAEFLTETARRTGCGILCDVNNIYVSATNFRFDPIAYMDSLPGAAIGEIHLAGHHAAENVDILIDDHGSRVALPVWELYSAALKRFGAVPTLIEWDTKLPPLTILLDEARHAQELADVHRHAQFA